MTDMILVLQRNVEFKKRFLKEYSEEEKSAPPENKPGMVSDKIKNCFDNGFENKLIIKRFFLFQRTL